MNTLKKRRQSVHEEPKPEIVLNNFKCLGNNVIDLVYKQSKKTLQKTRYKKFSYQNNSLILLIASNYVYETILKKNINSLLSQFQYLVTPSLFHSVPCQFNRYLDQFTIKFVLKNCCLLINEAKQDVNIHYQLNKTLNQYPFFRFCLIFWARCKAIKHFEKYEKQFPILLGNQKQSFFNFLNELRYITLDILCQCFSTKMILSNNFASEIYGAQVQHFQEINVQCDEQGIVYIQNAIINEFQTNNSQNQTQPCSNKVFNKSRFSSEFLSSIISPRPLNESICHKCSSRIKFKRCITCKQQSSQKLKSIKVEQYVSLLKICNQCGKKEIIYRGDYCKKCEIIKLN